MVSEHLTNADFVYWTYKDPPDPFEALALINGTHPGVQKYSAEVTNTRDSPDHFNLEDHGFRMMKHDSALLSPARDDFDFCDAQQIRDEYWPELRTLLKSELKIRSLLLMENVTRTSSTKSHVDHRDKDGRPKVVAGKRGPPTASQPFHVVHNDFSPIGSRNAMRAIKPSFFDENGCSTTVSFDEQQEFFRLREEILLAEQKGIEASGCIDHTQWDGADYEGRRWAHFSIWRPLVPVERDPLAFLDPSSLFAVPSSYAEKRRSYVSIAFPHRDRKGLFDYEGTNMMPVPPQSGQQHRWYWTRNQQPNEVYAIKLFDSEAWKSGSLVMPCAAHSAFKLRQQDDKPPRQSIETRCIAIW